MALACRYKFFWDIGIHVWYLEFDSGVKKGDSATFVASSSNEGTENSSHCIFKSEYDPVDTLKSNDSLSLRANSTSQPSDLNHPMPWLCFSGFQIVLFAIPSKPIQEIDTLIVGDSIIEDIKPSLMSASNMIRKQCLRGAKAEECTSKVDFSA